ncbi:MAG: hypothetical protein ABSF71_12760 [Terriglobia bacterium]|jgi:hypothetical protein
MGSAMGFTSMGFSGGSATGIGAGVCRTVLSGFFSRHMIRPALACVFQIYRVNSASTLMLGTVSSLLCGL